MISYSQIIDNYVDFTKRNLPKKEYVFHDSKEGITQKIKYLGYIYLQNDIKLKVLISHKNFSGKGKNDLIFIHSNPEKSSSTTGLLTKNINQDYLNTYKDSLGRLPIPTDIFDKIIRYIRSYVICGTEIKFLVENEFKTQEQISHEAEMKEVTSQTKISKISLYVAFVALAFSFLSPLIFDTTINKSQMDKINEDNKIQIDKLMDIKNALETNIDSISQ